jgi:hypothetical protein
MGTTKNPLGPKLPRVTLTPPKPKPKKQRGYGQASEGRTKKQAGGINDPRNKLTTAQKRFYGGKMRDFSPSNPNIGLEPDKNVRTKRPGGFSKGGSIRAKLSSGGPVAKPN